VPADLTAHSRVFLELVDGGTDHRQVGVGPPLRGKTGALRFDRLYNRQSLDGIVREGLFGRIEKIFDAFGCDVVRIKNGAFQRAAFAEPCGEKLRAWIDACPNQEYAASML
jgi:pyruvate dehydrogenase complex dehydrogenase (E1) component